ncbi:DUF1707 SHOCT-like domain-containing protein [Micromonospora polyrhachis]|uniref:DUF1707 domain-containing protein n=1 Tax=Micromonospora polyrhachis TaxID=1282883 RepID=A0A7W7SPK6_9ACTN|nr:DUF1707 domain-containing protein [Micromonospora polyrhachis]MBB4958226.1 hypothetical protein [Micromonospora polyrhachis]
MDRRDEMRAADSDRTAAADRLRNALDEGRLDLSEYDERLQRAYAAKTYGELNALLVDLPETVPTQRAQLLPAGERPVVVPEEQVRFPGATRRWLVETWGTYFGAMTITTAVWGASSLSTGETLYYWPVWVAGPWGAVLVVSTVGGLINGAPQQWAAKRARKAQEKIDKRMLGDSDRSAGCQDD